MRFGGHESFYLRENWLAKGLHQVKQDPQVLYEEFAEDHFGIGKNMLRSMIFWMRASRLVTKGYKEPLKLTSFGELVLVHDPFMVNPLTWWMIHLNLMTSENSLHVFPWFFNTQRSCDFTSEDLYKQAIDYFKLNKRLRFSTTVLQKDLHCLMSSYIPKEQSKHPEDSYLCPLSILDLVRPSPKTGRFHIHVEDRSFPIALIAYAIWRCNHSNSDDSGQSLFSVHNEREFRLDKIYSKESNPLRLLAISDEHFSKLLIEGTSQNNNLLSLSNIAGVQNVILRETDESKIIHEIYHLESLC